MGEWLEDYYQLNVKPAFRDAMRNFRANICIFVVVYILEVLLGTIFIASNTNDAIYDEKVKAEYDYHLVFRGLSENSKMLLVNSTRAYKFGSIGEFRVTDVEESEMDGNAVYDVYVKLIPDNKEYRDNLTIVYYNFLLNYRQMLLQSNPGSTMETSPLYYADAKYMLSSFNYYVGERIAEIMGILRGFRFGSTAENIFGVKVDVIRKPFLLIETGQSLNRGGLLYTGCTIFALVCSAFVLYNLFTIRTNEHKHTYGIYVTFGADRKKLLALSRLEMSAVGVLTLIPAYLTAIALSLVIFLPNGFAIKPSLGSFIWMALITLALIWIVLSFVLSVTARKFPSELLSSADNANYVSSPRRSSSIGSTKLTMRYSLLHFFRFRRYFLKLAAATVTFAVLFVGTMYMGDVYGKLSELPEEQFTMNFAMSADSDMYSYHIKPELASIEGITRVEAAMGMSASMLSSHVLFNPEDVAVRTVFAENGDGMLGTPMINYAVLDANAMDLVAESSYNGELKSGEDTVIFSAPSNMSDQLKLEPGDSLQIATLIEASAGYGDSDNAVRQLELQMDFNQYEYKSYTVAAVAESEDIGDSFTLYIPEADYINLTKTAMASMFRSHIIYSQVMGLDKLDNYSSVLDDMSLLTLNTMNAPLPYVVERDALMEADDEVQEYLCGTNRAIYVMVDEEVMAELAEKYPNADIDALNRGELVVSCDGYWELKLGDPLTFGKMIGIRSALSSGVNSVNEEIEAYMYKYTSYNVGAIIDNGMDGIYIYLPEEDYYDLLSMDPYYTEAKIYVEEDLTNRQIIEIQTALKSSLVAIGGGSLTNHNTAFFDYMEDANNIGVIILVGACFLLVLATPCLIYMQLMFYRKRRDEMLVFTVFGGSDKTLGGLHLRDGLVLALFTMLLTCGFGAIVTKLVHEAVVALTGRSFALEFPWMPYFIAMLIMAALALFSVLIPYLGLRREHAAMSRKASSDTNY